MDSTNPTATQQAINEMQDEYQAKYDFYESVALKSLEYDDQEMYLLAVKRASSAKMMLDHMPSFKLKMTGEKQ